MTGGRGRVYSQYMPVTATLSLLLDLYRLASLALYLAS